MHFTVRLMEKGKGRLGDEKKDKNYSVDGIGSGCAGGNRVRSACLADDYGDGRLGIRHSLGKHG